MKHYHNGIIGLVLWMLWICPAYGMHVQGQSEIVEKVLLNNDSTAVIHVFPIASEWQMFNNKADLFNYVLFGNNKMNHLDMKKNMWSDFVLDYEEVITLRELARQAYRGAKTAISDWWYGKKSAEFQYVVSREDVNTAAYTVLAKCTNGVYTLNDLLDKKDKRGQQIDPMRVYVEQSGEGRKQVTTIVVFVLLEVRKSIAALNTDGKNKYKDAFIWYPTHTLIKAASEKGISSKVD